MGIEHAPSADDEEQDCPNCDAESPYVLYDNDKVCTECGFTPQSGGTTLDTPDDSWQAWFEHRREEYSGFTGEDRVKMVGGFLSPWNYSDF